MPLAARGLQFRRVRPAPPPAPAARAAATTHPRATGRSRRTRPRGPPATRRSGPTTGFGRGARQGTGHERAGGGGRGRAGARGLQFSGLWIGSPPDLETWSKLEQSAFVGSRAAARPPRERRPVEHSSTRSCRVKTSYHDRSVVQRRIARFQHDRRSDRICTHADRVVADSGESMPTASSIPPNAPTSRRRRRGHAIRLTGSGAARAHGERMR